MRAVRYHEHGGPDVLETEEIDRPEPDEGEVLVEVAAAGINPVDVSFRTGEYPTGGLPWIPGSDLAGTVAAVGDGVEEYAAGDRVFATGLGRDLPGTCSEYAAVPTDLLAHLPENVDMAAGAAVALVGVTAWQTLIQTCELKPAERCLVHGGSGGVGHVAVQLADAAGAKVTTTAAEQYHDRLAELGADHVVDYGREDLGEAISEGGAADVILDHRLDEYISLDTDVAAPGGRIVGIGNVEAAATIDSVGQCRGKLLEIYNTTMFATPNIGEVLDALATLMAEGEIEPAVASEYDLGEVGEAQQDVLEESFFGKLVVTL